MKISESFPDLHMYRGLSIYSLLLCRIRIVGKYLIQRSVAGFRLNSDLLGIKRMQGAYALHDALVIAGGPSVQLLNPRKVLARQADGLHVFAMNMYCSSSLGDAVNPDFYVLSDPDFFGNSLEDLGRAERAVWEYIVDRRIRVIVPALATLPVPVEDSLFFNNLGLEGWSSNIDPRRPRGYSAMVAHTAIGVALFFGYKRIYLAGVDNDMFRNLYRDCTGTLRFGKGTHHHETGSSDHEVGLFRGRNIYRGGVAAYFEDLARVFDELRLFSNDRVIHVDPNSLVDAFRGMASDDLDLLALPVSGGG